MKRATAEARAEDPDAKRPQVAVEPARRLVAWTGDAQKPLANLREAAEFFQKSESAVWTAATKPHRTLIVDHKVWQVSWEADDQDGGVLEKRPLEPLPGWPLLAHADGTLCDLERRVIQPRWYDTLGAQYRIGNRLLPLAKVVQPAYFAAYNLPEARAAAPTAGAPAVPSDWNPADPQPAGAPVTRRFADSEEEFAQCDELFVSPTGDVRRADGQPVGTRKRAKKTYARLIQNDKRVDLDLARLLMRAWQPIADADAFEIEYADADASNLQLRNMRWVHRSRFVDRSDDSKHAIIAKCGNRSEPFARCEAAAVFFGLSLWMIQQRVHDGKTFQFRGEDWVLSRVQPLTEHQRDDSTGFVPIAQWPNYEISAQGIVRNRTTHAVIQPKRHVGHMLIQLPDADGHYTSERLHMLVAAAFLPPEPNKSLVRHKDGDFTNNHVDNLERYADELQPVESLVHAQAAADGLAYLPRPTRFAFQRDGELFLKIPEVDGYIGDKGSVLGRNLQAKSISARDRAVFSVHGKSVSIIVKRTAMMLFRPIANPERYRVVGGKAVVDMRWKAN